MNNTKAIEKLKESKEHLDLELISQEEYDKIKEELRPFIVLTDDKKSVEVNEKINNKYYSFNCRMCDESINLKFENISNNVTNYKCSLCSADNWVDPASNKFQEIEEEKFDKSLLPIIKEVKKEDNSELFKSKYEPMPLDFPKNTFKSIGLLSPKGHWGWNGTSWVSTTKKVLESVENSTTSSNATEQKKNIREKKSFGMKLFLSFGLTIIISIAIQVVNPNWAEGSKTARQAEWGKTFGNSSDIENYLPKKETPVQFALSGLFAVIWLAGVYTIFKDN